MLTDDEKTFLRRMARSDVRRRLLALADTKSGRRKIAEMFWHTVRFDERWIVRLPHDADGYEQVIDNLRQLGAGPRCTYLCDDEIIPPETVPLEEAMRDIVGKSCGRVVIVDPETLGYYEGEEEHARYILHRPR